MEVTQATGRFLDVRFEVVDSTVEFLVALTDLTNEVFDERLAFCRDKLRQAFGKFAILSPVAAEVALVEQTDIEFDVLRMVLAALFLRMDGVTQAEVDVPERAQKGRKGIASDVVMGWVFG